MLVFKCEKPRIDVRSDDKTGEATVKTLPRHKVGLCLLGCTACFEDKEEEDEDCMVLFHRQRRK